MNREQRVILIEGNWANSALDNVALHLDGTVIKKQLQAVDVFCNLGELLTQARFGGDLGSLDFEPDLKVIHQWFGLDLACFQAVCSQLSPDSLFDLVELRDTLEPFTGNGRGITVTKLFKLTACVRLAIGQFDQPRVAAGFGQGVVACIFINLRCAAEAG
mgnify:CR=1 FL=1